MVCHGVAGSNLLMKNIVNLIINSLVAPSRFKLHD